MRSRRSRSRTIALLSPALAVAASLGAPRPADSAPSPAHKLTPAASGLEIVVLEAPGCVYCDVFRAQDKAAYEASPRARTAPLRFLDLNDEAADQLQLTGGPVNVVPTFVVMKDRKEVARIVGYVGIENFMRVLNSILAGSEER